MRDARNQSVKKKKRKKKHGGDVAAGWGRKKRADVAKKEGIFKDRNGVKNPGEGAVGALVFLGINVTELLQDQRRPEKNERELRALFFFFSLHLLLWKVQIHTMQGIQRNSYLAVLEVILAVSVIFQ